MNQLSTERTITTKELADVLGVDVSTIQKTIKRINATSEVLPKFSQGQTPRFNQQQVTLIKQEIQKHHNLQSRQIDSVNTELELFANYKAASEALAAFLSQENNRLKQEKEKLQIELDESKDWYSVKRMEKLNPGVEFNWRVLKKESEKLGIEMQKVFDKNYGEVNAYHVSVWESLYFDTLNY